MLQVTDHTDRSHDGIPNVAVSRDRADRVGPVLVLWLNVARVVISEDSSRPPDDPAEDSGRAAVSPTSVVREASVNGTVVAATGSATSHTGIGKGRVTKKKEAVAVHLCTEVNTSIPALPLPARDSPA